MVMQAVLLQPMEGHAGAVTHPAAHGAPHTAAGRDSMKESVACGELTVEQVPGRSCSLRRGAHAGVSFLAGTVAYRGPHLSTPFLKDCTPWKGSMLEQVLKNCSPEEGPMLRKFVKDCLPMLGPHTGAEEDSEEESLAKTTCDELTTTPIPHPPESLLGGSKKVSSEVQPEKKSR